jgi:predicted lactoylglutathione lyase
MKRKVFTLILAFFAVISFAQNQTTQNKIVQSRQISENTIYQLFPTQNYWTFIKLDTRNGKMWQVHFSIKDNKGNRELILSSIPLVTKEKEINGRFTLYPTENMYNFLLLDQIDGNVYQVQWSMEEKYRGVVPIH